MAKQKNDMIEKLIESGDATVLHPGAPCVCGPGFCAQDAGVGFYGYCNGSRAGAAQDCLLCGAPHQSTAGCWACKTRSGNNPEQAKFWLRVLRLGIRGQDVFAHQDVARAKGRWLTLDQALDELEQAS